MKLTENEWKIIHFALGYLSSNYDNAEQETLEENLGTGCDEGDIDKLADRVTYWGVYDAE